MAAQEHTSTAMGSIHNAIRWFIDDEVLHAQRIKGSLAARSSRAVFIGFLIGGGSIVLLLLGTAASYLLSPPHSIASALGALFLAVVWVALMLPFGMVFLREARIPYRLTISSRGVESRSLCSRVVLPIKDVGELRARTYRTHSRVPGGSSRLEARLRDGGTAVLLDSRHCELVGELDGIIRFFERIKGAADGSPPAEGDHVELASGSWKEE
jgi:hypothetical protein